ncbi:hypothetical protein EG328_003419 [Venturia inaequalis]|nr:hypothetical protein EG328_003419 [Venturia inaequalis]
MGNFLVYRELSEPFPAGEKKKAKKRKRVADGKDSAEQLCAQSEHDRQLVGSLVDSYGFKPGGLIKKTLNVKFNNVNHHIVSYYSLDDVKAGAYVRPVVDPQLAHVKPRPELITGNPFKSGIEGEQQNPDIWGESPQITGEMMLMSMPGAQMSHDSPLDTHVPVFNGPGSFSAPVHPLPQPMQFSGHISNQYVQQPQPQYGNDYPVFSQSIDSIPTAMPGPAGSGLDFNTTPITSSQSTAFDVSQLSPTALPTHSSYNFQWVSNSSDGRSRRKPNKDTPFKAPVQIEEAQLEASKPRLRDLGQVVKQGISNITTTHENIYTIPNLLTVSRLLATPVIGYLVLHDQHIWAVGLFAYAGISDLVDGWIARKWKLQTVVGSVIDPMADKFLMTVLVGCLAAKGALPRLIGSMVTLPVLTDAVLPGAWTATDMQSIVQGFQYVVASTTLWSGASYLWRKDAVQILGTDEALKRKQGFRGRAALGISFAAFLALSMELARRENDRAIQKVEEES